MRKCVGHRWEAVDTPRKEKNGDIMLLLGKVLKSSLKDSVVFSTWSAYFSPPQETSRSESPDPGRAEHSRGARPPEQSAV